MARTERTPPDDGVRARDRHRMAAFARGLVATLDARPAVRDTIVALARSVDAGTATRHDAGQNLDLMAELLGDEVAPAFAKEAP